MNYNCGTSENLGIDDRYVSSYAALRNKINLQIYPN